MWERGTVRPGITGRTAMLTLRAASTGCAAHNALRASTRSESQ